MVNTLLGRLVILIKLFYGCGLNSATHVHRLAYSFLRYYSVAVAVVVWNKRCRYIRPTLLLILQLQTTCLPFASAIIFSFYLPSQHGQWTTLIVIEKG